MTAISSKGYQLIAHLVSHAVEQTKKGECIISDDTSLLSLYEYIEKLEANQGEGASLVERSRWEAYKQEIDAEARIGGRVKALLDNPFDGFITVEYGNFSERANSVSELFATFRHLIDAGLVKFDP